MQPVLPKNIRAVEVCAQNKESLRLFERFYNELYIKMFTDEDKIESLEGFLYCINEYKENELFVRILVFCDDTGNIAGGVVYDYFDEIKVLAIEYIVVAKQFRGSGLASKILEYTQKSLPSRAEWTVIEAEKPEFVENNDLAYLNFWEKQGMKTIDFKYIQPALSAEQNPVKTLMLCALGNLDKDAVSIKTSVVTAFIRLFAEHAFGIEEPESDPSVREMLKNLENKGDELELISLI